MNKKYILIISFSTIMIFSSLYAPQPLLPIFSKDFQVSKELSSLLITIILMPLAFAPIFYGYFLEKFSAKKLLLLAIVFISLGNLIICFSTSFNSVIFARLIIGISTPAALTSIMTYISVLTNYNNIQQIMSYYIASTIMGGFLGRFLAGFISSFIGWRYVFVFLFISLIISYILILKLKKDKTVTTEKITFNTFKQILSKKTFLYYYLTIFCIFFVFAGLLNVLPFRMKEISLNINEFKTGIMYSGYTFGIVVSLTSNKIIKFFNNSVKISAITGIIIYLFSILILSFKNSFIFFIGMFFFCGGMFMIHSLLSGYLNKLEKEYKGIVNGLYVSFYYLGGSIGSYLTVLIYKHLGWGIFLVSLTFFILTASLFIFKAE